MEFRNQALKRDLIELFFIGESHQPITIESKESEKPSRVKGGKILLNRQATLQMIGHQIHTKFSGQSPREVQ